VSAWTIARDQWAAWIEQGLGEPSPPALALDSLDAELADRLARRPFTMGNEETISRPGLDSAVAPFDSMTTMVRSSVIEADEEDATRIHRPEGLEVGLRAPEDGLEVSLHAVDEPPTLIAQAPLSGQTVITTQSPPEMPPASVPAEPPAAAPPPPVSRESAPAESLAAGGPIEPLAEPEPDAPVVRRRAPPVVSGETVIAPPPTAPPSDEEEDGLFIPALTRPSAEPSAFEDPPDEDDPFAPPEQPAAPEPVTAEAPPAPVTAEAPAPAEPSPPDDLPPVISGETVIGPPPAAPEEVAAPEVEVAASGSFTSTPEPDESASTLIRGEIPYDQGPHAEDPVTRPKKVVIDPSASGVFATAYDEDEDEDENEAVEAVEAVEATPLDEEPQELDADDLVEEEEEDGSEAPVLADDVVPPPAPRPPPAPEPERAPLSVGPPPPPLTTNSLDAAIGALPVAPTLDEGWQVDVFAEHYAALLAPQRASVVASEVEFIIQSASLPPGSAVLDMGCGDGAHAVAMAARGISVTALDPSPAQLMRASQNAQATGMAINLVSGDMRQPNIDGQFDAVICVGGTLGMYEDQDDRIALQHMRDRLVPGGRLMLHVLNRDYIANRLPARSWWQGQGCLVLDEAQMYAPTSRLHVHRTVVFENGSQFEHNIGLRVYGLTDLVYMCAQVGLHVLEFSGSRHTRGRFYGATSSEIWLVAQRPA